MRRRNWQRWDLFSEPRRFLRRRYKPLPMSQYPARFWMYKFIFFCYYSFFNFINLLIIASVSCAAFLCQTVTSMKICKLLHWWFFFPFETLLQLSNTTVSSGPGYSIHQMQGIKSFGVAKKGYLNKKSEGKMRRVWQKRKCAVQDG